MKRMRFEIYPVAMTRHRGKIEAARTGKPVYEEWTEYRWRYRAKNGRIISVSAEGYKTKRACIHSINLSSGRVLPAAPLIDAIIEVEK